MKIKGAVLACLVAWMALPAGDAAAADIATLDPIGFSKDAAAFAFEEYGILDGSGFAYSNIYFIDTQADRYLAPPIRVRIEDEWSGVAKARSQARAKAAALIEQYRMDDNPGYLAAFNPFSELDRDRKRLRYYPMPLSPPVGDPYTLVLEQFELPPSANCTETGAGFRLKFTERNKTMVDETVYEDKTIPESRGCASDYELGGVMALEVGSASQTQIALVLVLRTGFEGSDGRWIAVPVHP